jgi:hypothetical protein
MTALSWIINGLSLLAWGVNIKWRKQAMIIFTVTTVLSIGYFWATWQLPFLLRSVAYLAIDAATLYHIIKKEAKQ